MYRHRYDKLHVLQGNGSSEFAPRQLIDTLHADRSVGKEAFSILCHTAQQWMRFEAFTILQLHGPKTLHNLAQATLVSVVEQSASKRCKAGAEHHCNVELLGGCHQACFKDPRRLLQREQDAAVDNVLL